MGRSVSVPKGAALVAYAPLPEVDEDYDYDFVEEVIEPLRYALNKAFPSVVHQDVWLGNEDHAVAGNGHALFGVSEYGGLLAVWAVPHDEGMYGQGNLHEAWVASVAKKFDAAVKAAFGKRYAKVGCASNGECFFKEV